MYTGSMSEISFRLTLGFKFYSSSKESDTLGLNLYVCHRESSGMHFLLRVMFASFILSSWGRGLI